LVVVLVFKVEVELTLVVEAAERQLLELEIQFLILHQQNLKVELALQQV
tara:strand:- start:202 stop:348 length:147 start_codon:yes stop_codon:yes gene_type:complete